MKSMLAVTCFTIGAVLAPVAASAADTPTGAYVKDSVITTKIKTKLAAEHLASAARIKVETDADGVVLLSGVAKTQDEAQKAVTIARNTEGVRSVKSELKVEP